MNLEEKFLDATAPEVTESFVIDTMDKAAWALDKIRERRRQIAEVEAFAFNKVRQISDWQAKETESLQNDIAYFEALLQPYAAEQLKGKKSKTFKLPNGQCSFRKGNVSYTKDDAALLEYVKSSAPGYIKTKESVDWAEFKKTLQQADDGRLVTEDGEVLACVTYTNNPDVFTVKTEE